MFIAWVRIRVSSRVRISGRNSTLNSPGVSQARKLLAAVATGMIGRKSRCLSGQYDLGRHRMALQPHKFGY